MQRALGINEEIKRKLIRLSFEAVCKFNEGICDLYDEPYSVLSEDAIRSALSVYDSYFEYNEHIASALFRSIICNHGFENGNKRTAIVCLHKILPPLIDDSTLFQVTIDIATGSLRDVYDISEILYGK